MGVDISLFQVTLSELKRIRHDPDLMEKWFFPDEGVDSDYDDKNISLYLGKSHHGLHFIISGTKYPKPGDPLQNYFVFGKHNFRLRDNNDNNCKYLLPREVKDLVKILDNIKSKILFSNFDYKEMDRNGIYGRGWCADDADYMDDLFVRLRNYYKDAAVRGNAIISITY